MKRLGKIAIGLAGGLAFNAGLCAPNPAATHNPILSRIAAIPKPSPNNSMISAANNPLPENPSSDNPYTEIAARNIFGLLPPAPPPTVTVEDPAKNLPKIMPQGIMGVFGHYQVLFKVAPPKPDPNTKDKYYILSEGEMQEEIEVKKIDNENSLVTFDNHGTIQELPLVATHPSGGAAGVPAIPTGAPSSGLASLLNAVRNGEPANPGNVFNSGGRNGLGVRTSGPEPGGPNSGMPVSFGGAAPNNYIPPQQQDNLPADARVILMEGQRAQWQTTKNPALNPALIPPTPLTSLNKPDGEGDAGDGGVPPPPSP